MSTQFTKEDLKSPDKVLKTLNQGFAWSQAHSRMLAAAITIFLIGGIGYSIYSTVSHSKENQAQEEYFKYEKSYLDKKHGFEEAARAATKPPVADAKKTPPEPPKAKATGDIDKDFGGEIAGFQKVIADFPSSKAAQMAALDLSEVYLDHKNIDGALQALQKVEPSSKGKDLLSSIVQVQLGNVLSEKGDCKGAVQQWETVLSHVAVQYMHDTVRMKAAFCYEKLNDTAKAEEMYKKITQNSQNPKNPQLGETGLGKEAEKYLRLLKFKKSPEGKGS